MTFMVTLAAGMLALIGVVGIFTGAFTRATRTGQRAFVAGRIAMTLAGLVSLLGGMIGTLDTTAVFGGVMMLIFGTAVSLPITVRDTAAA